MERHQQLKKLRTEYYHKSQEVLNLRTRIEDLEREIQRDCDHVWEYDDSERGGRSWHICRKCKKYR